SGGVSWHRPGRSVGPRESAGSRVHQEGGDIAVNLRFASALLALIALLLAVQTALAGSVANATWGWVTVRRATTPSYSPAARDQGNSAAKPNQVSRSGT